MHILFGHQSVGSNILEVLPGLPEAPAVSALGEHAPEGAFTLEHFQVGRNHDPASKLTHFQSVLGQAPAGRWDLALFKFCYVDILDEETARAMFDRYVQVVDELARQVQPTWIGHSTIPLRTAPPAWKQIARRLVGKTPSPEPRRNAARHAFNECMRERYGDTGLLFDLAACEARAPDGSTTSTRAGDRRVPALDPAYSRDGGHLNALGQKVMGSAFVSYLNSARRVVGSYGSH
jgi:lysophospholipase L1-like esterase